MSINEAKKSRIAIMASGAGTNAEKIFEYFVNHPAIEVVLLLCNNPTAQVLVRAEKFHIPSRTFTRAEFLSSEVMLGSLAEKKVTHIVLAGFLWLIPEYLIRAFPDRIINIHPALLPKYGGKGMYGPKVHEAVRLASDRETGITIHLVNENYDKGQIIFQATCVVEAQDSPAEIAQKVHVLEYDAYPRVIERWAMG